MAVCGVNGLFILRLQRICSPTTRTNKVLHALSTNQVWADQPCLSIFLGTAKSFAGRQGENAGPFSQSSVPKLIQSLSAVALSGVIVNGHGLLYGLDLSRSGPVERCTDFWNPYGGIFASQWSRVRELQGDPTVAEKLTLRQKHELYFNSHFWPQNLLLRDPLCGRGKPFNASSSRVGPYSLNCQCGEANEYQRRTQDLQDRIATEKELSSLLKPASRTRPCI